MLELAVLGLLLESPMHGYELRKRLTGLLGAFRAGAPARAAGGFGSGPDSQSRARGRLGEVRR